MTWRIHICVVGIPICGHDSCMCVTWLTPTHAICLMHACYTHIRATWLIQMTWLHNNYTVTYMRHDIFIRVTSVLHICNETRSQLWHTCESFKNVRHDLYTHKKKKMWHDIFIRVTSVIHICDESRSQPWHDMWVIYICATWLTHIYATWNCKKPPSHICDKTYSYVWPAWFTRVICHDSHVWHDSCTSVTWLRTWVSPRVHDSCMCVPWLIHVYVTWPIQICDINHSDMWHDTFTCLAQMHRHECMTGFLEKNGHMRDIFFKNGLFFKKIGK